MTKAAALYAFWASFDMPAYEENSVPIAESGGVGSEFPYITYEVITDSLGAEVSLSASLWYKTESWVAPNAKADKISAAIGRSGKRLYCDGGAIWLKRGTPFAQRMGDDSNTAVKRIYLNLTAEFLTAN